MSNKYDDIIFKKYEKSKAHPNMLIKDRAAQFAPFAALTGFEKAIHEISRQTQKKRILDENQLELLNIKINYINNYLLNKEKITITYFIKDISKNGGQYVKVCDYIRKIDEVNKKILIGNEFILFDDIVDISSETLSDLQI